MRKLLLLLFSLLSLCIAAVEITKIPSARISEQKTREYKADQKTSKNII